MAAYIGDRDDVTIFDIVGALNHIEFSLTEAFIKSNPELVPELSAIMNAHGYH